MKNNTYPFNAIVGQENMKKALILNIINPKIGGVLISGEKGTAKSTMIRGLANIVDDMKFVNLPLNITEDRLVGSIDIEKAINSGQTELDYGLLKKADGNILYIDEVNLLSKYIANIILEVNSSGINQIEREGLSSSHMSNFILIASMNPEEGILSSSFIDRFGLYVEAKSEQDVLVRTEIIKNRLKYEDNPESFIEKFKILDEKLMHTIEKARFMLDKVEISRENLIKISEIVMAGRCQGHRAELVMIETAKTLAAYNSRSKIIFSDIEEAAKYALPHRIRENISIDEFETCDSEDMEKNDDENMNDSSNIDTDENYVDESHMDEFCPENNLNDSKTDDDSSINDDRCANKNNYDENDFDNNIQNEKSVHNNSIDEFSNDDGTESEIGDTDNKLKIKANFNVCKSNVGTGKRNKIRSSMGRGRYIKYKSSSKEVKDIAIDATIRSAAIKQKNREKTNSLLKLDIRHSDIKEKVREARTGATILFLVDASGSMGARKRMMAVKGAVLSLLNDAYQKRDNVGIIAFRQNQADVILNITRSVDLAEKSLKSIKTGGKTPLACGLNRAHEILRVEKIRNKNSLQYMVLVTDGKANVGLFSDDCDSEVRILSNKIRAEGINSMVLDTEKGMIEFGLAKNIAKNLDAEYVKLDKCTKSEVESKIKDLMI